MQRRRLGHSELWVSAIGLGTMTFGDPPEGSILRGITADEASAHRILDRAVDGGINLIDTADSYGEEGRTETLLGRWLAQSGRRTQVVLATKGGFRFGRDHSTGGASRRWLIAACEASLRRLRTDYLDLYQVHMMDPEVEEAETIGALESLVEAGKIRAYGTSNTTAVRLMTAGPSYASVQLQYSLLMRDIEREVMPATQAIGASVLAWSPLAGGFLTGKYAPGRAPDTDTRFQAWPQHFARADHERGWQIVAVLQAAAAALSVTPGEVALAWLLGRPNVASALLGVRSVTQLEALAGAAYLSLAPEISSALDDVSRAPAGYPYDFIAQVRGRWR